MHLSKPAAWIAVIVVWALIAGTAYVVFLRAPGVGTYHDDGIYLVTAKALAEGEGYRIISVPGEPVQNKYPILFPLVLSLGWAAHPAFPENLVWLRLVPVAAGTAWLALAWLLLMRLRVSKQAAAAMLLLVAASPWVIFLATALLAETLFAALVTAGVLVLTRIHDGHDRRYDGLLAGALMALALLTRAAGVAPVAAGFVALALQRKWRTLAEYAISVLLVASPWLWWVATHGPQPGVEAFYSASTYGEWNIVTHFSWSEKLDVLTVNALYAASLGQFWGISTPYWFKLVSGVLCSGLVARGLWLARRSPIALVVVLNFAVVLAFVWPPVRYIVPVLPFLVWLAYLGAGSFRPLTALIAMVLLATAGFELSRLQQAVRTKGSTAFSTSESWIFDWPQIQRQARWIKEHTPENSILITILDPTFYLLTGRKALRPFSFDQLGMHYNLRGRFHQPFGTAEDLRIRMVASGADYVVITPRDQLEPFVDELSKAYPGSFTLMDGTPGSGSLIYQIDRSRLESTPASHRDRE